LAPQPSGPTPRTSCSDSRPRTNAPAQEECPRSRTRPSRRSEHLLRGEFPQPAHDDRTSAGSDAGEDTEPRRRVFIREAAPCRARAAPVRTESQAERVSAPRSSRPRVPSRSGDEPEHVAFRELALANLPTSGAGRASR
jgi:hypothetical protein